jgi:hypothetical protein
MPVFRAGQSNVPSWCMLKDFEFITLAPGKQKVVKRGGRREHFIVCRGIVEIEAGTVKTYLTEGGKMDLLAASPKSVKVRACESDALVFRAMGRWPDISGSGVKEIRARPVHSHGGDGTEVVDRHRFDRWLGKEQATHLPRLVPIPEAVECDGPAPQARIRPARAPNEAVPAALVRA